MPLRMFPELYANQQRHNNDLEDLSKRYKCKNATDCRDTWLTIGVDVLRDVPSKRVVRLENRLWRTWPRAFNSRNSQPCRSAPSCEDLSEPYFLPDSEKIRPKKGTADCSLRHPFQSTGPICEPSQCSNVIAAAPPDRREPTIDRPTSVPPQSVHSPAMSSAPTIYVRTKPVDGPAAESTSSEKLVEDDDWSSFSSTERFDDIDDTEDDSDSDYDEDGKLVFKRRKQLPRPRSRLNVAWKSASTSTEIARTVQKRNLLYKRQLALKRITARSTHACAKLEQQICDRLKQYEGNTYEAKINSWREEKECHFQELLGQSVTECVWERVQNTFVHITENSSDDRYEYSDRFQWW